jgi:hypothetical protein
MFDTMNSKSTVNQLFNEEKWRYIWLLLAAGVLLFLALVVLCLRLWMFLRHCHCGT